jgi:hypothetical protein
LRDRIRSLKQKDLAGMFSSPSEKKALETGA